MWASCARTSCSHCDRLIGEVVREVVGLAVAAFEHADGAVVLGDDRVVLAGRPGQEAPPVVEAPRHGPVVERTGRALDVVGRQVPLAEATRHVAVVAQDPRQRRAALRPGGGVARERPGVLRDRAEPDAVMVAPGQQRGARRRAHRRHVEPVVREPHLLDAGQVRRTDLAAEGVRAAEAGVVDQHEQHVRRAVGRLRTGHDAPVRHRAVLRAPCHPAEGLVAQRQHRAVGVELAHGLSEGDLEFVDAALVALDHRLQRRAQRAPAPPGAARRRGRLR